MARALQCMDLHAIKLATSARYALLAIPPPSRPLRRVSGLPKPSPPPPMAWHRLPATPTRVPHRTGRSRVEPRPHDPRAQSPRPVWVCGAFSPFVPLYIGGGVLNFAHVHTRARMLLTVPDSAGSHPTSGPGSVRQFTQHGPHLTVTLVTDVPL